MLHMEHSQDPNFIHVVLPLASSAYFITMPVLRFTFNNQEYILENIQEYSMIIKVYESSVPVCW